jgi:hypothetical protein
VYSRDDVLYYEAIHDAKYARFDVRNKNQNFNTFSNIYIEDGSYLRLKNLQLGMRIPQNWTAKIDLSSVRLYVNMTNLLTFTKYTGLDPELDTSNPLISGIDAGVYPLARTYTFGIDVNF